MWTLITVVVGTLVAIFFATVPAFKQHAMRPAGQFLSGFAALIAYVVYALVMGYFLPTLFLNPTALLLLPLFALFWFAVFAIRAALKKPPGKKLNSLKEDFAIFLMLGPIVFIVTALMHPALVVDGLSRFSTESRSLMGAGLSLALAIGLFALRLNYLRVYASLEIAIGLGASYVAVRGLVPNSPIRLEYITALAGALYVIVRGLDNYRKAQQPITQD